MYCPRQKWTFRSKSEIINKNLYKNNIMVGVMRGWRSWVWPVKVHELGKFLPLFFIKLCASFNFSILATIKDTVIVTSSGGAEVIPVLKGGVVIACAFLVMLFYSKLSNHFTQRKLFYIMLLPFLIFFLLYGFVLFPQQSALSPTVSADWLLGKAGHAHAHWIAVYRYWMHSLFFVMAEIWGGVVIGLLFWGFANQVTSIKDAARFYVLYSTGGHLGTLLSGSLVYTCTNVLKNHAYQDTILILMLVVASVICIIMGLYWYANNHISQQITDTSLHPMEEKNSLSLKDSFLYIIKSPYLGLIALMVIGYGLSVNIVEVSWKSLVKLQYPDPLSYQGFMGMMQFVLGITSLIIALFLSGGIIRRFGWYISAQATPIVLGLTSLIFFALFMLIPDLLLPLVICGAIHNVACKSMKYCLFDPTKEMAYIPLSAEAKTKGKAAVDLVGARFGKTGSSWIQLLLIDLVGSGSVLSVVPYFIPVVLIVVGTWLRSVYNLHKRFMNVQQPQTDTAPALTADALVSE